MLIKNKYVKWILGLIFLAVILWQWDTCLHIKYKKLNHISTTKLDCGLYIECYEPFKGGVYAGDITSYYLTDSLQLDTFVGWHDDHDFLIFECNDKNVIAKRCIYNCDLLIVRDSTIYIIDKLKNQQ